MVGIIGLGSMGKRRKAALEGAGYKVSVYDPRIGSSVESLRSFERADAMFICSPARLHAQHAEELLLAGYRGPLFVEKPLALSAAECAVFREWPSSVQHVGYNWRWHKQVMGLVSRKPKRVLFFCWTDMSQWPGTEYGPPLLECSHEVDLALALGATYVGSQRQQDGMVLFFDNPYVVVEVLWRSAVRERSADVDYSQYIEFELGETLEQSYVYETLAFIQRMYLPFEWGQRVIEVCERAMKETGP